MNEFTCGATGKKCENPDCFNCKVREDFLKEWDNIRIHDDD